jgi:uncharacterized protein YuzB (UPF0349 family)
LQNIHDIRNQQSTHTYALQSLDNIPKISIINKQCTSQSNICNNKYILYNEII